MSLPAPLTGQMATGGTASGFGRGTSLREHLDRRLERLKAERTPREHEWRLLQRFIAPRRGRLDQGQQRPFGRERHRSLVNNAATRAARTCANGLASNVVSPAYPWFRLAPQDPDLAEFGTVRSWLDKLERKVLMILQQSGFYQAVAVDLFELVVFGTSALGHERDFENFVRWQPWTTGEYWIAADFAGRPNTVYREFRLTVDQAIGWFGDACSRTVREAYDRGNLEQPVTVRHAVEPVTQRWSGVPRVARWKYASVYWDPGDAEKGRVLYAGGTNTCPAHVARWEWVPPDAYGNSPGMDALGDIASLQTVEKRIAQGIDKKAAPAFQGPATSFGAGATAPFDQLPGAFNAVPQATAITPVVDPRSILLQDAQWYWAALQERVERTFFVDLFRMLDALDKTMTAREVAERAQEKLLLIGPVLTNLNFEKLNPTIDGILDDIFRASEPFWLRGQAGMLEPPPQELQGTELKVDYISVLQQAQQAVRAQPIQQLASFVGAYAQLNPAMVDKVDFDEMLDQLNAAWGGPANVIRDDAVVAQTRDARAQQQQRQQQLAEASVQADAAAKLGRASTAPDTALGAIERGSTA